MLDPDAHADVIARMSIVRMRLGRAKLTLGIAEAEASIALRGFMRSVRVAEAGQFAEFRAHPDVLELEVAAASWYPEVDHA